MARTGLSSQEALESALAMMADEQTTGAAGRYALLADLADTATKALAQAKKQEEAEALTLLATLRKGIAETEARLKAVGVKVKPKRVGRPVGSKNSKKLEPVAA